MKKLFNRRRYVKMFGISYYSKEIRRFPWSEWKPVRNDVGQIIPYRYTDGKFDPEWHWRDWKENEYNNNLKTKVI